MVQTGMVQGFLRDGFLHLAGAVAEPVGRGCERRPWVAAGVADLTDRSIELVRDRLLDLPR